MAGCRLVLPACRKPDHYARGAGNKAQTLTLRIVVTATSDGRSLDDCGNRSRSLAARPSMPRRMTFPPPDALGTYRPALFPLRLAARRRRTLRRWCFILALVALSMVIGAAAIVWWAPAIA